MLASLAMVGMWVLYLAPTDLGGPVGLIWVSGHSMEPTLYTGDLAILYRQSQYQVGEIVAFDIPEGGTVIHRVVEVGRDGYRFRGDNRDTDDPWILGNDAIRGRQVLSVSRAAHVMALLGRPPMMAALVAALVLLGRLKSGDGAKSPAPEASGDGAGSGMAASSGECSGASAPTELVEPLVVDAEVVGELVDHRDQHLVS